LNVALDYLPGSVNYDPIVHAVPPDLASQIVWFDALVTNIDRTARNTNMLMWHRAVWLIDHGSTLYFHHSPGWDRDGARPRAAFEAIKDHVLLRFATRLAEEDERLAHLLTTEVIDAILALVPDTWMGEGEPAAIRAAYRRYLLERLAPPRAFVEEALRVR